MLKYLYEELMISVLSVLETYAGVNSPRNKLSAYVVSLITCISLTSLQANGAPNASVPISCA